MEKRARPTNIRLKQSNRERLELAQALGLGMTEVLDGLLENYFDAYVKKVAGDRIERLQKVLSHR